MGDDEVLAFEINEHDINDAYDPYHRKRKRLTKSQHMLGIWADGDSDSDDDAKSNRNGGFRIDSQPRKGGDKFSAPVNFVSGGIKQGDKILGEDEDEEIKDSTSSDLPSFQSAGKGGGSGSYAFGQMIAGMRSKHGATSNDGLGNWERHTKGIGAKLLQQMGYKSGKGLGKAGQGILQPVEAAKRTGRGAVGMYGPESNRPENEAKLLDDIGGNKAKDRRLKPGAWRKDGSTSAHEKPKYSYKTIDDVISENSNKKRGNLSSIVSSGVKVIDMTGREQKVYDGYEAFGNRTKAPGEWDDDMEEDGTSSKRASFDCPELTYNLNLLVDLTEDEIIKNDRQLKYLKDQNMVLENEEKQLSDQIDQDDTELSRLQQLLELVEGFNEKSQSESSVTLDDCKWLFVTMKRDYYHEYKMNKLIDVAAAAVFPLINTFFVNWSAIEDAEYGLALLGTWKDLLVENNTYDLGGRPNMQDFDPFHRLIWDIWMPHVRRAIMYWSPRIPEKLIRFLEIWRPVLPIWIFNYILQKIVLTRLQTEVDSWDPRTDTMPIHVWLHPWLPLMGDSLQILYASIRQKLGIALSQWHPSDKSAKLILDPWKDVFSVGSMDGFISRHILPRLEMALDQFKVNPANQDLTAFHWIMDWIELASLNLIGQLLVKAFFPKWHQALYVWLSSPGANFTEITNWYQGWKNMFPIVLSETAVVKDQFRRAIEVMNKTVAGGGEAGGMPPPGAKEEVAYLRATERQNQQRNDYEKLMRRVAEGTAAPANFKDLLERKAVEHGLSMIPIPNKYREGKIVYRIGSKCVYVDRNVVFVQRDVKVWDPVSLSTLLEQASKS